jgi:glycerophosphoryl diester phosphodiesterase
MIRSLAAAAASTVAIFSAGLGQAATQSGGPPIVIGHRGAPAERPEHTASSYILAIDQGADFIEPDLVPTRDGALVARHENEIGATTDVAAHPEFAARKTRKTIDGQSVEGWFTEDFTLAELKTLRARERLPELRPASRAYDGRDPILTFEEVVALARREGARVGRTVGVYAELKHPSYFAERGIAVGPKFVEAARRAGLDSREAPLILECFEVRLLQEVRGLTQIRTVLLIDETGAPADMVLRGDPRDYAYYTTPLGLREAVQFADGIGPAKTLILPRDGAGRTQPPTRLVEEAHRAGLFVHPWTVRPENVFLPAELLVGDSPAGHGKMAAEVQALVAAGVDGLFSDAPGEAKAAMAARP